MADDHLTDRWLQTGWRRPGFSHPPSRKSGMPMCGVSDKRFPTKVDIGRLCRAPPRPHPHTPTHAGETLWRAASCLRVCSSSSTAATGACSLSISSETPASRRTSPMPRLATIHHRPSTHCRWRDYLGREWNSETAPCRFETPAWPCSSVSWLRRFWSGRWLEMRMQLFLWLSQQPFYHSQVAFLSCPTRANKSRREVRIEGEELQARHANGGRQASFASKSLGSC
jgi:hypothetical protein